MADVLMIAGKPETIFKARDFEYLVEKHMGYEAAKYFREYAEKADEEVRSAKAGENTDLASYEADLESNHRAFQDIQTEAAVITGVLQEKRINREKIAIRNYAEHHEDFCDVMADAALDHLLNTVLPDDLFIPDGGFSPTKEEVDNMNRAKETADKAAKVLDTLFGGLADLLKTI